jgi:hypothetical protein
MIASPRAAAYARKVVKPFIWDLVLSGAKFDIPIKALVVGIRSIWREMGNRTAHPCSPVRQDCAEEAAGS